MRGCVGSLPQRSRENVVQVVQLESVVLVESRHPCDQIKPHEHVQNRVDRRIWHGHDQQPARTRRPGNRSKPRSAARFQARARRPPARVTASNDFFVRQLGQVLGERALHQRHSGNRGLCGQLRVDADSASHGETEQRAVVRADVEHARTRWQLAPRFPDPPLLQVAVQPSGNFLRWRTGDGRERRGSRLPRNPFTVDRAEGSRGPKSRQTGYVSPENFLSLSLKIYPASI